MPNFRPVYAAFVAVARPASNDELREEDERPPLQRARRQFGTCALVRNLSSGDAIMSKPLLRLLLGLLIASIPRVVHAQDLQLHYDWRHTVDPRTNRRNFPALTFKSFKAMTYGSFLIKLEADLDGERHNVSKGYLEVSQSLRFWEAPIYAIGEYAGGLGLFDDASGGYYLANAYSVGAAYPFPWKGGWASVAIAYKHSNLRRPSHDPQVTVYWGRPFAERWAFASTGVLWTQNRNRGDDFTASLTGKRGSFLAENELWWRAVGPISVGSEVRVSRNVYATDERLLVYPTLGVRYLF
jgi:hypothetical protein